MSLFSAYRFNGALRVRASATLIALTTILPLSSAAQAEDDAAQILKAMSDYVSSQQSISLTFNSDIEVITPEIQKIQFTSSGKLVLGRPDKLRASRTGGYTDVEIVFDGKTVAILGKNINAYAQSEVSGNVDKLVDVLRDQYSLEFPGADLLLSNPYEVLMADVLEAKHIGQGVVDGVLTRKPSLPVTALSASTLRFAIRTPIGNCGSKWATVRFLANSSLLARLRLPPRNTRC